MSMKSDLVSALMLMTRLPVRGTPTRAAGDAAWAWPVAGLIVAGLGGGLGLLALRLGLAPQAAALLVLGAQIVLTGALHEDGLADTADGVWGGHTRDRRLEIMRDSRIGTYGVVALILSLSLRWTLIAVALTQAGIAAVLIAAVVSRAAMAVVMRYLPAARTDGLSRGTGRPPARAVGIGVGLATLALLTAGWAGVVAAAFVAGLVAGAARIARAKIGGQTGDVLGAVQQIAEIAVLIALTSV